MKALFLLLLSLPAQASWQYNENSGIGIYQPEGWSARVEGRATRLKGPAEDKAQSQIFLGSDWVSRLGSNEELRAWVASETGERNPKAVEVSGLAGFRTGTASRGAMYLLRVRENVIVVQYQLKGSADQMAEGHTMISSVEIRTKGNEGR